VLTLPPFKELAVPITVTFDIQRPTSQELKRIRSFFERLGWEHLGNTAYRYPQLRGEHVVEDWFNHVIPALMLLRALPAMRRRRAATFASSPLMSKAQPD
jgi:hypothetical protein